MKIGEVRAFNTEELNKQLETAERELLDLHFRLETKQLVNSCEIRRVRKDIARMKTILRERELTEVG